MALANAVVFATTYSIADIALDPDVAVATFLGFLPDPPR
jgi:hypothetical protein